MTSTTQVPTGVADLTAGWLSVALAPDGAALVTAVDATPIGTGQVADSVRLALTWDPPGAGPETVVAKVTSASETSRAAARVTRTYEIEVGFYRDLAPTLAVRAPACHAAHHDPERDGYVVVLEDAAPAQQGDQLAGCSPDEAAAALDELALLHGPRWGDSTLRDIAWLNRHDDAYAPGVAVLWEMAAPAFLERNGSRLDPASLAAIEWLSTHAVPYLERPRWPTVVHGDYRLDNLLFGRDRVIVVDWQTVALGPALSDVSYFLGGSLLPEQRAAPETDLVRHYHERLVAAGGELTWDECWWGYRRYALDGLVMAVVASFLVVQTDRGDAMFRAMADGSARHAADMETTALV